MVPMNETRMDWLRSIYKAARIGEEIYKELKKILEDGVTGIIYSPANVGDTVWLAALAQEYKRYYGFKRLLFVVRERQADMLPLFPGIDDTIPLEEEMNICLRHYVMVQRLYDTGGFRYGHFPADLTWEPPYMFHCLDYDEVNAEHLWDTVLGLPFGSPKSEIQTDRLDDDVREALKKSVMLLPSAFSVRGVPEEFWERAAEAIREKGYAVYTNYGGLPYDYVIKGTQKMELSLREMAAAGPCFARMVGSRSGIFDLLAMTESNLTILTTSDEPPEKAEIEKGGDFWDVRLLSEKSSLRSFWYHKSIEEEVFSKILEDL